MFDGFALIVHAILQLLALDADVLGQQIDRHHVDGGPFNNLSAAAQQNSTSSISSIVGHRVPVTPRQMKKRRFETGSATFPATDVRAETVWILSLLGAAFACIVIVQVWRQVSNFRRSHRLQQTDGSFLAAAPAESRNETDDWENSIEICDYRAAATNDPSNLLFSSMKIHEAAPPFEVVQVNMNIVKVVHHCSSEDPSRCKEDGCGDKATFNFSVDDGGRQTVTASVIAVDKDITAEDIINKIAEVGTTTTTTSSSPERKSKDSAAERRRNEVVKDFKYKALNEDSD